MRVVAMEIQKDGAAHLQHMHTYPTESADAQYKNQDRCFRLCVGHDRAVCVLFLTSMGKDSLAATTMTMIHLNDFGGLE